MSVPFGAGTFFNENALWPGGIVTRSLAMLVPTIMLNSTNAGVGMPPVTGKFWDLLGGAARRVGYISRGYMKDLLGGLCIGNWQSK